MATRALILIEGKYRAMVCSTSKRPGESNGRLTKNQKSDMSENWLDLPSCRRIGPSRSSSKRPCRLIQLSTTTLRRKPLRRSVSIRFVLRMNDLAPKWYGMGEPRPPDLGSPPCRSRLAARRHCIPKQQYRVANWAECDSALRQCGSLTVWFLTRRLPAGGPSPARHKALRTYGRERSEHQNHGRGRSGGRSLSTHPQRADQ